MPVDTREVARQNLDALTMIRAAITQSPDIGVGIALAYGATDNDGLANLLYSTVGIAARTLLSVHGYDVEAALREVDGQITRARRALEAATR